MIFIRATISYYYFFSDCIWTMQVRPLVQGKGAIIKGCMDSHFKELWPILCSLKQIKFVKKWDYTKQKQLQSLTKSALKGCVCGGGWVCGWLWSKPYQEKFPDSLLIKHYQIIKIPGLQDILFFIQEEEERLEYSLHCLSQ